MGMTIMKKIYKPHVYIVSNFIIYISIVFINIFLNTIPNMIDSVIFSAVILLTTYTNYKFLSSNYNLFYHYNKKTKIILSILCFLIIDIFGHLIEAKVIQSVNISLCLGLMTLIFPYMTTMLSILVNNRFQFISNILYYIGIFEIFAGSIVAIINLFFPVIKI